MNLNVFDLAWQLESVRPSLFRRQLNPLPLLDSFCISQLFVFLCGCVLYAERVGR